MLALINHYFSVHQNVSKPFGISVGVGIRSCIAYLFFVKDYNVCGHAFANQPAIAQIKFLSGL
jgi:hypothetical protein